MSRNGRRVAASIVLTLAAFPVAAQNQLWIRQIGTHANDHAWAAASDGAGGVFLSGATQGNLGGPNAGLEDVWFARYDGAGNRLWSRQIGTNERDETFAAAPDGSGGVYLGGSTLGSLGGPNAGGYDAWLARYDNSGNQLWIRQFGTGTWDFARSAAPDGSGGLYIAGTTWGNFGGSNAGGEDAWLARYDGAGNQVWVRQLGTSKHEGTYAAAPDGSGGVYIGGKTNGSLVGQVAGGWDAWLARYDGAGNQLWSLQLGTNDHDYAFAAAQDGSGGLYIAGHTLGNLGGPNAGSTDAWLARYDGAGNQLWARQPGTMTFDDAFSAAPDGSGGVYVGGTTFGSLGGPSAGDADAWLVRYDGAGNQSWIHQLGSSNEDRAFVSAPDGSGGVFLGGRTYGNLGSQNAGLNDAWLARFDGGCPAPASYCMALLSSSGCTPAMTFAGSPSLSNPGGFRVDGVSLEQNQNGLMFFGTTGQNSLPFFGGTLCVNAPLHRMSVKNSGGAGSCSGLISYTLAEMLAQATGGGLLVVGATVDCQLWFRDPPAAQTVGLTDGLEISICP